MLIKRIDPGLILKNPVHLLSFGFGTGLSPVAPGTFGTLIGFPLFACLMDMSQLAQLTLLSLLFLAGIVVCHITGKAVGESDHSGIVIDEYVCFAMVLTYVPATFLWWISAFTVFRFFDIVKIWPASWIDKKLKNAFGVMFDDLVAAIFSVGVLLGIQYLLQDWPF